MKTHTSYTIQKITILTLIMVGYLFGGSTFAYYCTQAALDNLDPTCDGKCGALNGIVYTSSLIAPTGDFCGINSSYADDIMYNTSLFRWEWTCEAIRGGRTAGCATDNTPPPTMCLDSTNGGCFIADTTVVMADGSSQSIQDIKVGDKLKAVDGTNTVLSLIRPTLGHQDIYAINGQEAFFTANHPFLTTDGWKSLDPITTKKEIPDLEVSTLVIGDILITEAGKVLVISISASPSSSSTQLYNFELDGDHTYFANGFAVHNKLAPVSGCNPYDGDGCPGTDTPKLGNTCTYNSDCYGSWLYCDNNSKTCKYEAYTAPNMIDFDDPACEQTPPTPIDGLCGSVDGTTVSSIPTTNLCSQGTPSFVFGAGPYLWNCVGIDGGTTDSCTAQATIIVTPPTTVIQTRTVNCVSSTGAIVDPSFCTGTMPTATQTVAQEVCIP